MRLGDRGLEPEREIGIRIALGATTGGVEAFVVRKVMQLIVTGPAVGLAGAALAPQALTSLLFGGRPASIRSRRSGRSGRSTPVASCTDYRRIAILTNSSAHG